MPAQVFVTHNQLVTMAEQGHGVIICEGPSTPGANILQVWVMDEETLQGSTHRDMVIDPEGQILGDMQLGDDE